MTSAFSRFPPRLQAAIASNLGWTSLRPVQELSSHALLDGKNAVILAPTAGGKTEAAMFPLLATLMAEQRLDQLQRVERSVLRLERQNVQVISLLQKLVSAIKVTSDESSR